MANSVDPDQMPHNAASDLGLHCSQRPISPTSWCYNGNIGNKVDLIIECIFFSFFQPILQSDLLSHYLREPVLQNGPLRSSFVSVV